jgi:hypothetical protein
VIPVIFIDRLGLFIVLIVAVVLKGLIITVLGLGLVLVKEIINILLLFYGHLYF